MSDVPESTPDVREVVLAARNVAKSYGSIRALKGVNFDIHRGQVTTLFGENGAGKSTLMKILSGVVKPSSGEIILDGEPVSFASSTDARNRGISIIHQELSLAPNMTVRDNIFMGRERTGPHWRPRPGWRCRDCSRSAARRRTARTSRRWRRCGSSA